MSHRHAHGHGARLWPLFRAWCQDTAPEVYAGLEKEAARHPSFAEAVISVLRRGVAASQEEAPPASGNLNAKESA